MTYNEYARSLYEYVVRVSPIPPTLITPDVDNFYDRSIDLRREFNVSWHDFGFGIEASFRFDLLNRKATINSPTSQKDVVSALAFASLYEQVVRVAALTESYARSLKIVPED